MVVATYSQAFQEFARNFGAEVPDREWLLTNWDTWERNPHYRGAPGPHPNDDHEAEVREYGEAPPRPAELDDCPF